MIIDSSALIAILLGEPEAQEFARLIAEAPKRYISAFSWLEASIVIEARKGESGGRELDLLIHRSGIEVVPLTPDQSEAARKAWRTFGRGNHPAGLNIGDCCAYALSKMTGEPLLFKGGDFGRTDVARIPAV